MAIQKLIAAELAVNDLDDALAFNVETLGLAEIARDGGKVYLGCAVDDQMAQLVLSAGGTGARSLSLGVDSPDDLDFFEHRLANMSVRTERRHDTRPGHVDELSFQLPTGQEVLLVPRPDLPLYPHAAEPATGGRSYHGVAPVDIDHITLSFTDEAAGKQAAAVLTEGLGFAVSDIFLDSNEEWLGAWTRAGELHHDIGLMRCQPGATLHHLAWTLENMEHHKRSADVLVRAGYGLEAPPGRHGVGGNIYSYLWTPGGNRYEFSSEMPRVVGASTEPQVRKAGEFNSFSAWGGE